MNGPGVGGSKREATVFVFEHVTGGGMAGLDLPASLAAEGAAMRRAIVGDFAAVPGVRVVTTIDARFSPDVMAGVEVRSIADRDRGRLESLAAEADYTLGIAPETDGILAELCRIVGSSGGRWIGPSRRVIGRIGNKAGAAVHFARHGIPSPETCSLEHGPSAIPSGWDGPIVVKPRVGAGSVDTVVVVDRRFPPWVGRDFGYVAQPFLPGRSMSASFLVDAEGHPTLLAVGRQRIEVAPDGRISYRGGTIPAGVEPCPAVVAGVIASVVDSFPRPNLLGFVGVDFLLDDEGRATVLEINPRPTTSYVGLARLYPPGTIAGAWLAAVEGPLAGTDWPDRLRLDPRGPAVSFDADGTIRPGTGAESS